MPGALLIILRAGSLVSVQVAIRLIKASGELGIPVVNCSLFKEN